MVVELEFMNRLKDFGLNSYESKLWIALLSRGISTAGELSDISNVPRSRAYDVLESLEKKGFIIVKLGKPIKYIAVSPSEVIERVQKKIVDDAAKRSRALANLDGDVLEELNVLHGTGIKLVDPTDRTGSFRGRDKAYDHLALMIKNAKNNIIMMTSKAGLSRKLDSLGGHLNRAAKRGVNITLVLPEGTDSNGIDFAKIKISNKIARFCMVDNKELFLFVTNDTDIHKNYDSAVWVDSPYFVEYFKSLVE